METEILQTLVWEKVESKLPVDPLTKYFLQKAFTESKKEKYQFEDLKNC